MDQSKFNNQPGSATLAVPKRSFSLEFFVGLFAMAGVGAAAYLAVGLAGGLANAGNAVGGGGGGGGGGAGGGAKVD